MQFSYEAKHENGDLVQGSIEASSEDQAVAVLHQKGLIIVSLEATQKAFLNRDLTAVFIRPNKKDVVIFTRQLATLIDADVPLVEGLHTLSRQIDKVSFQRIITTLAAAIEGGSTLSMALMEHDKVFGQFYVSLVRAGEVSGKLQATLLYLADYMERSAALSSKIRGALAYPVFVLSAIIVVGLIVMTFVMPQLISILKESGNSASLPITTRALIWLTDFINSYIILILIALVGVVTGSVYYVRSENGRKRWDYVKLHLPQFGRLISNFYIARLSESLSTLIRSGVPILESLSIAGEVVGNSVYQDILNQAKANVQSGGTISEIFEKYPTEFPVLVTSMLSIGEKTGRTDYMLDNITKFYKTETENTIANLSQLIEPILILLLGLGVGILVSAVLLPIYGLVGSQ